MFRFLKHGVSFILFFIGVKMLLCAFSPIEEFFTSHSWISLAVIIGTLTLSVLMSIIIADTHKIKKLKKEIKEIKEAKDTSET